ncbi:MAG: carboxypeptidase-like regulatory domain-containing protein [Flavobacteriales bacterium]|nr:carboxypeptidase-like regulatory domain-containing protein [Flavobacteriales bacterium]
MMRQKGIKLSVPEPCHEKWSEMTQSEKGRFCTSCQKEVVDFSILTDDQLINRLSKATGKTCGRFHRVQLDKCISPTKEVKGQNKFHLLLTSLLVFAGLRDARAQSENITHQEVRVTNSQEPLDEMVVGELEATSVLRGTVVDSITKEPLIGASVVFADDPTVGVTTDFDGNFTLDIPPHKKSEIIRVNVSFIGSERKTITFMGEEALTHLLVEMSQGESCVMLGAVVITQPQMEEEMEKFRIKQWFKSQGWW